MTGIIGKKIGMTRVIQDDGRVIPVTLVTCEPNEVTQVKTVEKDGYPAIVLGFDAYKNPFRLSGECEYSTVEAKSIIPSDV